MNCFEKVTVNAQAINWLKEKYPELCTKAGLCERIGGRLYTKTFIDPPAAQPEQVVDCPRCGHVCSQRPWVGLTDADMKDPQTHIFDFIYGARWAEAKLKERNT